LRETMMEHTILVNGTQSAVLTQYSPTQYTVQCYVGERPTVAYDATTAEEAERWAKAVIEVKDEQRGGATPPRPKETRPHA
jgi:hypothetical protein